MYNFFDYFCYFVVLDDDLSEFHAIMSGNNPQEHDDDSTAANSIRQELDFDSSEETDTKSAKSKIMFIYSQTCPCGHFY
jgi:hypothetical protein